MKSDRRIAAWRPGNPEQAFRREEGEPVLEPPLVQEACLPEKKRPEALHGCRIRYPPGIVLPVGEMRREVAVERVVDVAHGVRRTTRSGSDFIRSFQYWM